MTQLPTASRIALAAVLALAYAALQPPGAVLAESPWFVVVESGDRGLPTIVDNRERYPLHVVAGEVVQRDVGLDDLAERPYVELHLVSGPEEYLTRIATDEYSLARFEAAGLLIQTARFYPAIEDGEPASFVVWDLVEAPSPSGYRIHEPTASDLATLEEIGVEVLVSNGNAALPLAAIAASLVLAVAIVAAGARWFTRSR